MAIRTDPKKFANADLELADQFRALAHPARLQILRELARHRSCVCGEIVEVLPLSQSTVSQHLSELKAVGLVRGELEGTRSCYCLDTEAVSRLQRAAQVLFAELQVEVADECC